MTPLSSLFRRALVSACLVAAAAGGALAAQNPQPGSIEAGTLSLPSAPGSVRGLASDASVDAFSGQVGYSVPFELPAGPGGIRPAMELRYDGSLGNGPYGIGWSLVIPQLRRSTRLGVPGYGPADELELIGIGGGGRLVDAGNGSWRVEGKGQSILVEFPAGTSMVVVTDADGVRYFLGTTPASRQQSGTSIAAWFVQSIEAPSGQVINFTYTANGGQLYPSQVTWGPGGQLRATFAWAARPDGFTSYRTGYPITTSQRLSSLAVSAFGTTVRTYLPTYSDSMTLSRMIRMRMTGVGGAGGMPTLNFRYGTVQNPTATAWSGTGGWHLGMPDVTLMDVDGDGVGDLVRLDPVAGHSYRRNLAESGNPPARRFAPAQPLPSDNGVSPSLSNVRLMDIQGDTKPDLVRVVGGSWWVQRLVAGQWSTVGAWSGTAGVALRAPDMAFCDVNGDDRPDVLQASGANLVMRLNGDAGLGAPVTVAPVSQTATILPGQPGISFRDMNADGLADAVRIRLTAIDVWPGRGDGSFAAPYVINFPTSGAGALTPASIGDIELSDLNRDGVTDVIHVRGGLVTWYPTRPGGALLTPKTQASPEPLAADVVVAFADGNGNGSEDVLWSSPRGFWVLDLAGASTAGMLTEIDNGLGQIQRFGYDASARIALAAELDPALPDWTERLPISVPVPVQTDTLLSGVAPTRSSRLLVRDGFWDAVEKRFGGFLVATRTEVGDTAGTTLVEITSFNDGRGGLDRVLRGTPARVERRDGTGALLSIQENSWSAHAIAGLPANVAGLRVPVVTLSRTIHHEGAAAGVVVETAFSHDGDGNIVREERRGRTDRSGDESVIVRVFASSATRWVRSRLIEERTETLTGTRLTQRRYFYDGAAAALPHGQIDRGWLRRVDAWNGSAWVTQQSLDLDSVGNPVRRVENGVSRDISWDANQMFPVAESVHPSAGATLTWSATWDAALGKPLSVTHPSGVTRHVSYDAVGRLASESIGAAPPHRSYSYAWAGPRPTTTVVEQDGAAGTRTTVHVFDGHGEPLCNASHLGNGQMIVSGWSQRDARGQVMLSAEPFYFAGATPPITLPAGTPSRQYERDALGRLLVETRPDGTQTAITRSPLVTVEDVEGLPPVAREVDGLGRLVLAERFVGGVRQASLARWDAAGRMTGLDIVGGAVVVKDSFSYDPLGRLLSATDPDMGRRTYTYDSANRLVTTTDAAGRRVTYGYDGVGRLLSSTGNDGTVYRYHYDAPFSGSAAAARTAGRLAWVEEPTGRVELAYDEQGRVSWRARTIDGITGTVSRSYSPAGLLLAESTDDGFAVAYDYDGAGRLVDIGPGLWTLLDADASGRPLEEGFGNGVIATTGRDQMGREATIAVDGPNGILLELQITRNALGAPEMVADVDGVGVSHLAKYGSDAAGRVISAQVGDFPGPFGGGIPYELEYAWDGLGNISSISVSSPQWLSPAETLAGKYSYVAGAPRRLASISGPGGLLSFSHDKAGRIVQARGMALTWDPFGHLRTVTVRGRTIQHAYGYDGARVRTQGAAGVERRFSDDDVAPASGNGRQHYLRVGSRLIGRVDRAGGVSTPVFFHNGIAAGPALVTDDSGKLIEERLYEPFGSPLGTKLKADPHGAANHPVDPETGWADAGARWLASEMGSWTAPDPIVRVPGDELVASPWRLNPYAYAGGDPLRFWDPDGREEHLIGWTPSTSRPGYAYVQTYFEGNQVVGQNAGIGFTHVEVAPGQQIALLSANVQKHSLASPDPLVGFHADAQVFKLQIEPGKHEALGDWGFEFSFLDASLDASVTDGQLSLGAQANFASGAVSYATQDARSRSDDSVRIGASAGGGGAFRLHYGDADGDNIRELGFGGDVGPISLDLKTERIHAYIDEAVTSFKQFLRMSDGVPPGAAGR